MEVCLSQMFYNWQLGSVNIFKKYLGEKNLFVDDGIKYLYPINLMLYVKCWTKQFSIFGNIWDWIQ